MSLIHKIGLGSVQFGLNYGISNFNGQTPINEVKKILNFAQANNIQLIDTASAYGDSERVIGELNENRFKIVSKFLPPKLDESITIQFQETLDKLQTKSIFGYLAHRPLNLLENTLIWKELIELKAQNKIEKIGFSLNQPEEYFALKKVGLLPDLVQVPFNYFDHRFLKIIIELKERGCEVHTRSTFLQGLFFMDPNQLSDHFNEVKSTLIDLQNKHNNQLNGVLMKHVLENEFIDKVILGTENLNQLKNNINALESAPNIDHFNFHFSDSILVPSNWP
jgi:aryl-alcohol dehydrogenase-like predicted oxidoreductase